MGKRITITESQLKNIIRKTLSEAYRSGYVGHDGNSRVGGKWWSNETTGTYDISGEEVLDYISDAGIEITPQIQSYFGDEDFRLTASFDQGEDQSVGMGYYCDLNDVEDDGGLSNALISAFGNEKGNEIMDNIIQGIENNDGWDMGYPDEPEYDSDEY